MTGFMLGTGVDPRVGRPAPSPSPSASPTPGPTPTPPPDLHLNYVSPSSVVGSAFLLTVTGRGFDGGAHDNVYKPNGTLIGHGDVTGRTSTQVLTYERLAGASPGTYTIEIQNGSGPVSNRVTLTLFAEVAVSPLAGPAGTLFHYSGRGFTGSYGVTSHLTGHGDLQIPTAPDGAFIHTINTTGFPPGDYDLWATDNASSLSTARVTFTVR